MTRWSSVSVSSCFTEVIGVMGSGVSGVYRGQSWLSFANFPSSG
jgi:hypothetical protein